MHRALRSAVAVPPHTRLRQSSRRDCSPALLVRPISARSGLLVDGGLCNSPTRERRPHLPRGRTSAVRQCARRALCANHGEGSAGLGPDPRPSAAESRGWACIPRLLPCPSRGSGTSLAHRGRRLLDTGLPDPKAWRVPGGERTEPRALHRRAAEVRAGRTTDGREGRLVSTTNLRASCSRSNHRQTGGPERTNCR